MWQLPILPAGCPTSTFGVVELNFCVRNEYRWFLNAIVTTMVIYPTYFYFGRVYTYLSVIKD